LMVLLCGFYVCDHDLDGTSVDHLQVHNEQ
jgi:hypothetical protein